MRGTGSLQHLLGRSHNAKKRTRARAGGDPAILPPPEPPTEQRPLPAGRVRCPVCQAELPDAPDAVNLHLGALRPPPPSRLQVAHSGVRRTDPCLTRAPIPQTSA
jgi:hypothetical protein